MFEIKAIQAEHGDALFVTYGDPKKPHHLLVDGGPAGTRANLVRVLEDSKKQDRLRLDALVVTHYDLDHIQGVIELLADKPKWLEIDDVWFNGHCHLHGRDRLGASEGDTLSNLIKHGKYKWNKAFEEQAIHQKKSSVRLHDDFTVYVVSPDEQRLAALAHDWTDPLNVPSTDLVPGDRLGRKDEWPPGNFNALVLSDRFDGDKSVPNGSSIALVLEYKERRVLLAADAYADVVRSGLAHHFPNGITVDLLKVSHHGSKANTDEALLDAIGCRRFLISTSGKGHKHPDNLLVARLLARKNSPDLLFNYAVDHTTRWRNLPMSWPRFNPIYPDRENLFVRVDVMADGR